MAKIFTKLNVADTISTNGTKCFRKLIGAAIECFSQLVSKLFCNVQAEVDTPVSIKLDTDGQLGVKGTPNAQNVANLIVVTGEFGGNVTAESADGINTTGTAEMKFAVCGRPTNGSIVFLRATDEWALGLLGSADPADTVDTAGRTDLVSNQSAMPNAQEMTTMLFSTKGEMNGTATHENAEVAEQVSSYASGELALIGQPVAKTVCEATFVVNGKVEHQTAVLEGEAPSDPVADGTIGTPTQESTAQYHFHYAGWSKTEDGEVVGGGSGETVILEQITYTGFTPNTNYGGLYVYPISPAPFTLSLGTTYKVTWDGVDYECSAQDFSTLGEGYLGLGNGESFGGNGNNEPFIIGWSSFGVSYVSFDTNTSHTVAINELVESDEGLPIITEDTTFYAVYDKELRYYTASFYVNGELQSTQTVAYGESATPPEIAGEAGMVLQWSTEDFTITGDTDFYGVWVKDYILSGEFTFTYNESYHTYLSTTSAKQQLSVGGTYVVEWGDEVFSCVARDVSGSLASTPQPTNVTMGSVIGSTHNVPYVFNAPATWDDSQSNNEPFCIQTYSQGTNIKANIFTTENVGTITVNIYAIQ